MLRRQYSLIFLIAMTVLIVRCSSSDKNAPVSSMLKSNEMGLKILRNSLENHGGDFSSDSKGSISLSVTNNNYVHLGQSRNPLPPFESYTWERQYFLSLDSGIERSWFRQDVSGFVFENIHILKDGKGYEYDLETKTYIPDDDSRLNTLEVLPHTYLLAALKNALTVFFLRHVVVDGRKVSIVQARGPALLEFRIDELTGLVLEVHTLASSATFGVLHRKYLFDDYFLHEGLRLAGTVRYDLITEVMDTVSNTFTVAPTDLKSLKAKLHPIFTYKPANYSDRPSAKVESMGGGIYLYQNITHATSGHSYNVLFAEFADHILVCEAPVGSKTSEDVIQKIKETIPGKPIRYIVQSHHHSDHLAGIRPYIARGVSILTPHKNIHLINKIAKASFAHAPDLQTEYQASPKFEIVEQGKLIKSDGLMTVEIYNVGLTDHAEDMLVVYFPRQKVLFQSDMVLYKEHSHSTPVSRQFAKWLNDFPLDIDTIIGAHGYVMNREEVKLFKENRLPQHFGFNK